MHGHRHLHRQLRQMPTGSTTTEKCRVGPLATSFKTQRTNPHRPLRRSARRRNIQICGSYHLRLHEMDRSDTPNGQRSTHRCKSSLWRMDLSTWRDEQARVGWRQRICQSNSWWTLQTHENWQTRRNGLPPHGKWSSWTIQSWHAQIPINYDGWHQRLGGISETVTIRTQHSHE